MNEYGQFVFIQWLELTNYMLNGATNITFWSQTISLIQISFLEFHKILFFSIVLYL